MRCEVMLPNQCQCANTAIDGQTICLLHKQISVDTSNDEQIQQRASKPNGTNIE